MGPTRTHPRTLVPLQLENPFRDSRRDLVEYQHHLPQRLLIIWDGLKAHRSRLAKNYVSEQEDRIVLEFLPAYAPELEPVEYLWSHWKQHDLPNFCPRDFRQLSVAARQALRRMQRRPTLVTAFWKQAKLF